MMFGRAEYDLSADWTSENEDEVVRYGRETNVGTRGEQALRYGECGEEGMLQ